MSDETSQPTPPENPAPQEPVAVPENIPQLSPEASAGKAETQLTESTPTQEITTPESYPQIFTEPDITITKTPDTVTITEIMEPKAPVPEPTKPDQKSFLKSLLPKLKEKLSFRTEKRLSKIIELARKNGEIQNDEVEKLLHVSDASASRYLSKLVQRGNLRVSGSKNHAKYLPICFGLRLNPPVLCHKGFLVSP